MQEYPIELLKNLQAKQDAFFFKEALELYIPPQVGRYVGDDEPKDAAETIGYWLNNPDKQCLLLLGDSGAGKTLFGQWLTRQSFANQKLHRRIPLFIPLLAQKDPADGLIDHYLKKMCEITEKHQREWIKQQPLLLILDGFDEIHQKINLYRSNKLWQLKDVKIIISCRSQALANIYDCNSLFYPCDSEGKPQPYQLQEYVVNPFTEKQIDAYLQQYVSTHQHEIKLLNPDWLQWQTYQTTIQKLPGLQSLLNSPFMLSIVVHVLPSIIAKHAGKESTEQLHLARINLYDHFVEQWFARQKLKLLDAGHISDNCPIEDLFIKCSKSIANAMLQNNKTSIELTLSSISPLLTQQGFFGDGKSKLYAENKDAKETKNTEIKYIDEEIIVNGDKIKLTLILSGCPVMKLQDNQYAFLHKSLLEYFAARKLFEGVMADASIAVGYELNEKLLTNEPATLNFLAERVEQDEKLKQRLFDVLEESKFDERVEIAAANAITILNYARVSFSQKDLHRIRIKGADLSNAILDSTNLKEADLREVSLKGAWLNNATLGGALMQKITFGELAYFEYEEPITCIAYSPDGRYLAVGSEKNIQLWDIASAKCITLKGHVASVKSLAFSPDGKVLASSGDSIVLLWDTFGDSIVLLWDTLSHEVSGHISCTDRVTSVVFSPDGKYIASGGSYPGNKLRLWDAASHKPLGSVHFTRHGKSRECVSSVAFSPDGKMLAFGSSMSVCLWDVLSIKNYSYEPLSVFNGHTTCVGSVAFSPDGKILASVGDNSVRFWDVLSCKSLCVLEHTVRVSSIAFSPDGKILASGDKDGTVHLWDVSSHKPLSVMNGHIGDVLSVAFSSDGKMLASGSSDKSVRFWDNLNYKPLGAMKEYTGHPIATFSPDGRILASGSGWLGTDNFVRLWDTLNHKVLCVMDGHTFPVRCIAFSPDGKILASGGEDKTVRLWDVSSHKPLSVMNGHTEEVNGIVFSPDGKVLASGGRDSTVRLWDVVNHKPLSVIDVRANSSCASSHCNLCVVFSPDGKMIASGGGWYKTVCLWDTLNHKLLCAMDGHTLSVTCIAFSPDGKILASGGVDKTVRLWDVASHKPLNVMTGHAEAVTSVTFSPDGKMLISTSFDGSVRLWDIKTGECLNILKLASGAPAFKKEGEKIYLYLASRKATYTFEIKRIHSKFEFILLWSIGHDAGLKSEQLDLGGVVGLEQQNDRLLRQHEAIGTLSTKETDKVLEARNQLAPYNLKQPQYDLFSGQHLITPRNAMVSMVRKKDSKHAFLVIESIQDNHYLITRADFVIDLREKHAIGKIISTGQALIEICIKPLVDMQELAGQCVYKSWPITSKQASDLLAKLEADRLKRIHYLNLGNSSFYSKPNEETHSCLTWCEEHLSKIGIDVSQQKSWVDAIFANPMSHLPDKGSASNNIRNISTLSQADKKEEEPNTKQNCLMM